MWMRKALRNMRPSPKRQGEKRQFGPSCPDGFASVKLRVGPDDEWESLAHVHCKPRLRMQKPFDRFMANQRMK